MLCGSFDRLAWLPKYLKDEFHVKDTSAILGSLSILPYILFLVVAYAGGVVADRWIAKVQREAGDDVERARTRTLFVRKVFNIAGCMGQTIAFVALAAMPKGKAGGHRKDMSRVWGSFALVVFGMSINGLNQSAAGCNLYEVSGRHASLVLAIANTIGTIPGIVGVAATGAILEDLNNNWAVVYGIAGAITLAGMLAFTFLAEHSEMPLDDDTSSENGAGAAAAIADEGAPQIDIRLTTALPNDSPWPAGVRALQTQNNPECGVLAPAAAAAQGFVTLRHTARHRFAEHFYTLGPRVGHRPAQDPPAP